MCKETLLTLLGVALSILGALYIQRVRNKHDAARKFREAFAPELARLRDPTFAEMVDPIDPATLLSDTSIFEKHSIAVNEFRQYLPCRHQRAFDRAWHNYHAYDDTGENTYPYFEKYSPKYTGKTPKECRELAIVNMGRLLHFARHWMAVL